MLNNSKFVVFTHIKLYEVSMKKCRMKRINDMRGI